MTIETYVTEEGESFKADSLALAGLLSRYGFKGSALGSLIRGEEPIPLDKAALESGAGAKFKGPKLPRTKRPNVDKLWEMLIPAVKNSVKGEGRNVGDLFLQSGVDPEEFLSWLQDASRDTAQSLDYALDEKAADLWDKFSLALETGIYTTSSYEKWNLRDRKRILVEIYADSFYEEVSNAWRALRRNPKEMSRLLALQGR